MSHRGYNVGRAHQPRRHTAGAESRSFSAEGGNRQSSPESAVGPSNERSPSEFCPPNALISASFSQALLPGDRTGSLFEEGEASCLQEAGPHTNSQVRRPQTHRGNAGQPLFQHSHPTSVRRGTGREPPYQQTHPNGSGRYAAPPPGFQQLRPPAQTLNAQAQPYQPGHLTWQQRQQQEEYREPRPARRRQTPPGIQPPIHTQPPRRRRSDQNNASRANVSKQESRKPAQQSGSKDVVQLPGRPNADDTVSSAEEKPNYPACSICYEDCKVASIRPCNHKEICAICTIRMRRFYRQHQCSLCRAPAPEVILSSWREGGVPDWKDLSKDLSSLWINPSWEKGIYVDNQSGKGLSLKNGTLSNDLQAKTGRMCVICDPEATKLFPSYRSLMRHLEMEHQKQLCEICMKMDLQFCSELELFNGKGLADHMKVHPTCRFCNMALYSKNEEEAHMAEHHFVCQVCLLGGQGTYFSEAVSYRNHLRLEHFTCRHPDCMDSFVAFTTHQEVTQHQRDMHGLNTSRRRHGTLMQLLPPRDHLPTGPRTRDERGAGLAQHAAQVRELVQSLVRLQGNVPPSLRQGLMHGRPNEPEPHAASLQDVLQDFHGRLQDLRGDEAGDAADLQPTLHRVHDMLTGAADQAERLRNTDGPASSAAVFPTLHSLIVDTASELRRLQDRLEGISRREPFPDLATANQPEPQTEQQQPQRNRPQQQRPRLVSVTRRCPCGRLRDHPVVEEGSDPGTLACNDTCHRARRREQLASAFDIPDPARHTPVMERNKVVEHNPEMLQYAYHNMAWVKNVEQVMVAFVESSERQHNLPVMPKAQREAAHQMAQAFALTTQSFGQEPNRHIRLLKGGRQFVPRNLLSKEVAGKSLEEITEALAQEKGHALYLTDVDPRADIDRLFERWRGEFRVEESHTSPDCTVVTFNTFDQLKEALQAFGAGWRGSFRVDRSQTVAELSARHGLQSASNAAHGTSSAPQQSNSEVVQ